MKKKAAFLLAAIMTAASLTGCAAEKESTSRVISDSGSVIAETPGTTEKSGNIYVLTETEAGYCADEADVFYMPEYYPYEEMPELNTEEYSALEENGFRKVTVSPLSTFAADVDTASYANVRRMLRNGYLISDIPSGAVRAEEFINYFSYGYKGPEKGEPFGINVQIGPCPWNAEHKLAVIGLATEAIDFSEAPASNLVFLIDVSGSMDEENKLPLLKEAFGMLAGELTEKDRVSIVTYANGNDVILDGVSGDKTDVILAALDSLSADGYTNGGEGIQTAYRIAESHFIKGGNNRVILATDGDLNVGITNESDLKDLITEKKKGGVFLSVLGFGMGNYSDTRLETLADCGNGNYSYIDTRNEARKVLVEEMGANLMTVAKDVKLQVEFNPAKVESYRQVGYENRQMAAEDFENDSKDGGEIGAGHSVTVLYELVPASGSSEGTSLRYQDPDLTDTARTSDEWFCISVRYKEPEGETSRLLTYNIGEDACTDRPDGDFAFAAAAAEFAMVLSNSEYLADGSLEHVRDIAEELKPSDDYRKEFIRMVLWAE